MLTLEGFRKVIGYNPYHFWGLSNSKIPVKSECNTLVQQYAWQNSDAIGRNEIQEALNEAHSRLYDHLGYRIGPQYVTRELQYPRPHNRNLSASRHIGGDGRLLPVNVREGFVRAIGVEAHTEINLNAAVSYSDENKDGVKDTATIVVTATAVSGLDPAEIAIYTPDCDRTDGTIGTEAAWRIEPISATIEGNKLTIKAPLWLFVKNELYEGIGNNGLDPDNPSNFSQSVKVYRRYTDPNGTTEATAQAVLYWEANPPHFCSSGNVTDISTDPAATGYAIARAGIRESRTGDVIPGQAVYDATNDKWAGVVWHAHRQPDRVKVRFLAGAYLEERPDTAPDGGDWKTVVARLAIADMERRICGCHGANRYIDTWQTDLARISGNAEELYRVSEGDLINPFGTRRGHIYAFRAVRNLALTRAFSI